jgi:hypothetical protein
MLYDIGNVKKCGFDSWVAQADHGMDSTTTGQYTRTKNFEVPDRF